MAEQRRGDIRATLALNYAEALNGSTRTLTLPGGRQITVSVPAGAREGQELRLSGQGELPPGGGFPGDLILTLAVAPAEYVSHTSYPQSDSDSPTEFIAPPPPAYSPSPGYPAAGGGGTFPTYTPPQTGGNYSYPSQPAFSQAPSYAQQPTPPYIQAPVQQQPPQRRGLSAGMTTLLIVLAVLIIAAAGGLIYYTAVFQPNQVHSQATATAQAIVLSTAQAQATSTAQALATTQAQTNATATAVAQANVQATATATALQNIYTQATSGTLALNDPLSGQDNNNWSQGSTCAFSGGAYHALESQKNFFAVCLAQANTYTNFAYQVQVTITKGANGGIIFRSDSVGSNFYIFSVGQDGTYFFDSYKNNSELKGLSSGSSPAIKTGLNQSNLVAVVAQGNRFYFYVNQQYVTTATDNTYGSGVVGVFGGDFDTPPADAACSNAQVWTL